MTANNEELNNEKLDTDGLNKTMQEQLSDQSENPHDSAEKHGDTAESTQNHSSETANQVEESERSDQLEDNTSTTVSEWDLVESIADTFMQDNSQNTLDSNVFDVREALDNTDENSDMQDASLEGTSVEVAAAEGNFAEENTSESAITSIAVFTSPSNDAEAAPTVSTEATPTQETAAHIDEEISNIDPLPLAQYPTISLDNVTVTLQKSGRHVLENAQYEWHAGSLVALRTHDKETHEVLVSILAGLSYPTQGMVMHRAKHYNEFTSNELRGHIIGFVPRRWQILEQLSAIDNVIYAMHASGRTFLKPKKVIARELLLQAGFDEGVLSRAAGTLSTVDQRKLAIVRATSCEADTIVIDEPTLGLDSDASNTVLDLLETIAHSNPARLVLAVTDDDTVAMRSDITENFD